MVPKIAKTGRSFKGAAQYYLHDTGAQTSERVAFTNAVNLPTDNPRLAVAMMIDTATHAEELKQAAGIKGGRKLQKPVYSYSLAWHPSEAPTKAEQVEAARDTLRVLGLDQHQALIVAHTDKDHSHVHVIVNRVHPDQGRTASMSNDRVKLSQWAQSYEEGRGQVYCLERVQNNARRATGEYVKHRTELRRENAAWQDADSSQMIKSFEQQHEAASKALKVELDRHWRKFRRAREVKRQHIKESFKPEWRELFKQQREALQAFDCHYVARLKFALKENRGSGVIGAAVRAVFSDFGLRRELLQKQEIERKALAKVQGSQTRVAISALYTEFSAVKTHIIEQHKEREVRAPRAREGGSTPRQRAVEKHRAEKVRPRVRSVPEAVQEPQSAAHERVQLDPRDVRGNFDQARASAPPDATVKQEKKSKGERAAEKMQRKRNRSKERKGRKRDRDRDRER